MIEKDFSHYASLRGLFYVEDEIDEAFNENFTDRIILLLITNGKRQYANEIFLLDVENVRYGRQI